MNKITFNSNRKFGVEFEFARPSNFYIARFMNSIYRNCDCIEYGRQINNMKWVAKIDVSCGYELVTPVLTGWRGIISLGKIFEKIEKSKRFRYNNNCGLHVHVNVSDFNNKQINILILWWLKAEHILFSMLPNHRRNNSYCKSANKICNFNNCIETISHERGALNIQNVNNNKSSRIEFRLGSMNTDPKFITNWIRLLIRFVEVCKIMPKPSNDQWFTIKDFIRFIGLNDDNRLNKTMYELKMFIINQINKYKKINNNKLINEIKTLNLATK